MLVSEQLIANGSIFILPPSLKLIRGSFYLIFSLTDLASLEC